MRSLQHSSFNMNSAAQLKDVIASKWAKKGNKKLGAAHFHSLWSAKQKRNAEGWRGCNVLNRESWGGEGDIPCQLISLFKRMLRTPTLPSSKGTFSCVKHASDWTCKHPWRTHSNALIIGSNQMNYRCPVWWIIQRYILSSDINITFFSLCPPSWILML